MAVNPIKFNGVLIECKQDRYGTWIVKFETPQVDKAALMALSEHTEKNLEIQVIPPSMDAVFGKVQE